MLSRPKHLLIVVLLLSLPGATAAQQLSVSSNLPADYVDADFPLLISVQGDLDPDARIAMLIDEEDVSALFTSTEGGLAYDASLLQLPVGQHQLTVMLVAASGMTTPLRTFDMKVRSLLGVEDFTISPSVSLNFSAQPSSDEDPAPATVREVPDVLDGTSTVGAQLQHRDFDFASSASFTWSSEQSRALRFGTLAEEAPQLDLASYQADYTQGAVALSVGHIQAGNQRHLINSFGARGASVSVAPSERVDFSLAAEAGTQEVGWSNLLGVGDGDHRVMSANLGLEALDTPGALRVEFGWMDGSILSQSGFNEGAITDVEASSGMSVRVQASGLNRRLRVDAGWAQSTFDNPTDPGLSQGFSLVDVEEATNTARYLDANLDVLKNVKLGGSRHTASLMVGVKHERVDPLYRSVATSVRSDNLQNRLDVRAVIAGVTLQSTVASGEDNLNDIPSILTSVTDRTTFNVGVPLPRIFRGETWLPALTLGMDRTHQFGEGIPTNGGFSGGHVPDQFNVKRSLAADWRIGKVNFKYKLNHADQDNRQTGREDADFKSLKHGWGLGIRPAAPLQLAFDLGLDRAENLGRLEEDNTRRYGFNTTWRPIDRTTLAIRFSDTFKDDVAETKEQTGQSLDIKWSGAIPGASSLGGTYFVRFNRAETGRIDRVRNILKDRTVWKVNVGASLNWTRN